MSGQDSQARPSPSRKTFTHEGKESSSNVSDLSDEFTAFGITAKPNGTEMSQPTSEQIQYQSSSTSLEGVQTLSSNSKGKGKLKEVVSQDTESSHPRVHWDSAVSDSSTSHPPRRRLHKRNPQDKSHGETSLPQPKIKTKTTSPSKTSETTATSSRTTTAPPNADDQHISKQKGRRDEVARSGKALFKDEIRLDNFPALVLLKDNKEAYEQWMEMARKASSNARPEG